MLLFVGLGNPGAGYSGHRHNVGFMAVQAIAARHGIGRWRRRFQGVAAEGTIGPHRVLLLEPGTYMNESGRAVAEAVHFYKIPPHDTLVFHARSLLLNERRPPGDKDLVQHYVLSPFSKSERAWVETLCDIIAENASLLAQGEDASFQNKVHLAMAAKGFVEPKSPGAPPDAADGSA